MSFKYLAIIAAVAFMATGMGVAIKDGVDPYAAAGAAERDIIANAGVSSAIVTVDGEWYNVEFTPKVTATGSFETIAISMRFKVSNGDFAGTNFIVHSLKHSEPDVAFSLNREQLVRLVEDGDQFYDRCNALVMGKSWADIMKDENGGKTPKSYSFDESQKILVPKNGKQLHLNSDTIYYSPDDNTSSRLQEFGFENHTVIGTCHTSVGKLGISEEYDEIVSVANGEAKVIVDKRIRNGRVFIDYQINSTMSASLGVEEPYKEYVLSQLVLKNLGENDPVLKA